MDNHHRAQGKADPFPAGHTVEHRVKLSWEQVMEIEMLVDAIDFDGIRTAGGPRAKTEGQGFIVVSVKTVGVVKGFELPLLDWEWARGRGKFDMIPDWDFSPLLALWRAIELVSPHRLGDPAGKIETDPDAVGRADEPTKPPGPSTKAAR